MKIGLLADIHEHVENLTLALRLLEDKNVEQILTLGDLFDTGERIDETIELLISAGVRGVWGNHALGLCVNAEEASRWKYSRKVLDYFASLRPRMEIAQCLLSHGLPFWDPTDPTIYYLGESYYERSTWASTFQETSQSIVFVGHYHRWSVADTKRHLTWEGEGSIRLRPKEQYLIVIHAVQNGWCATFDTETWELQPVLLD